MIETKHITYEGPALHQPLLVIQHGGLPWLVRDVFPREGYTVIERPVKLPPPTKKDWGGALGWAIAMYLITWWALGLAHAHRGTSAYVGLALGALFVFLLRLGMDDPHQRTLGK